ncbi:MAG: putative transporter, domain pair and CorC HlyC [Geobacteraceae bacterium]|nr:putative transporter, domain pair and CorC HlyC [Geobacteraceae bacterium]
MDSIGLELLLIFVLILANGFFAGSELAIISARKGRIARLIAIGDPRAKIVDQLQTDSHRFLATVQIGVTLVGSLASAVGGATAVQYLEPVLAGVPVEFISKGAEPIAIGAMVFFVSYFSLILGELAPKTIGLQYADRMALAVAKPIHYFAVAGGIAVKFLTISNKAVLALLGIKVEPGQDFISREEVRHIVQEGGESGALTGIERKFFENMLDFTHTHVSEIMVPRHRMVALDLSLPKEEIIRMIRENMYSRYPVYRDNIENIVGFIHSKDFILGRAAVRPDFDLNSIVRAPFYVPENKKASDLLKEMQQKRVHMALVVDEYGSISGLVTTEDMLEELVGEIEDEHDVDELRRVQKLADGSLLVDALISINDLEELLEVKIDRPLMYDTLSGLILDELGRFPEKGERIDFRGFWIICEQVKATSIVKVRIVRKT